MVPLYSDQLTRLRFKASAGKAVSSHPAFAMASAGKAVTPNALRTSLSELRSPNFAPRTSLRALTPDA